MNRLILYIWFLFTIFSAGYSQVTPGIKLISSVRNNEDYFGKAVAIDATFAVVGASNPFSINDVSFATIFERDGSGSWNEIQVLAPSDQQPGDHFGEFISLSGNYLAVSAPMADSIGLDSTITDVGTVYIFERNPGGVWQQVAKIWAEDGRSQDHFGRVALSGKYLVIGSVNDYDANGANYKSSAGAVYVFERTDGGEWLPVQKLTASDRNQEDMFSMVAIDGYTKTIVIGAPGVDTDATGGNNIPDAGAVYVFKEDAGGNWNEIQKITAGIRHSGSMFGLSVSTSGNTIVVGAQSEYTDENDLNYINGAGAAYLFEYNGGSWAQIKKIVAHDRHQNDHFGNMVSLSGNYALVGAYEGNTDENGGDFLIGPGAAYLYERSGGVWSLKKKLLAPDRGANDEFGTSGCISGAQIIIGAPREDDDSIDENVLAKGAAYIFTILNPLGVEEQEGFAVNLYPNPTNGKMTLESDLLSGELNLVLRDVTGKLLNEMSIPDTGSMSYVIDQPEGVYFLQISTGEFSVVRKILVQF